VGGKAGQAPLLLPALEEIEDPDELELPLEVLPDVPFARLEVARLVDDAAPELAAVECPVDPLEAPATDELALPAPLLLVPLTVPETLQPTPQTSNTTPPRVSPRIRAA
jgi:hypothetical protein